MGDLVTWGALGVAITTALGFLKFWQSYSDRIAQADLASREARADITMITTQLAGHIAQFALYREAIAKEYITREVMREFEERVSSTGKENTDRLSLELKEVARRMDSVLLHLAPKDR